MSSVAPQVAKPAQPGLSSQPEVFRKGANDKGKKPTFPNLKKLSPIYLSFIYLSIYLPTYHLSSIIYLHTYLHM